MSEESTQAVAEPPASSPARLIVLLLVLGVAVAALVFDRTYARPGSEAAYKQLDELMKDPAKQKEFDTNKDGAIQDVEVKQILGEPNKTEMLKTADGTVNGKIDIYYWTRGLPMWNYSLYVVYSGKTEPLLHFCSLEERPGKEYLPKSADVVQPTDEQLDPNWEPPVPSGAGAGGGGGSSAPSGTQGEISGQDSKSRPKSDEGEEAKKADDTKQDESKAGDSKKDDSKKDDGKQDDASDKPKQDDSQNGDSDS